MSANRYSPSRVQGTYLAPTTDVPVHSELTIPGSKSLTNRELMIAAIADGPGRLIAPLHSDDSARMVDALRALGVGIEEVESGHEFGPDLVVTPAKLRGGVTIDCGQAGTVMRFISPLAGLAEDDVHLTAHETALHRPMGGLISALRDLGVDIDDEGTWALHDPRSRSHPWWPRRDRRVCVEPVRLGAAAGGPAIRRRTAPGPRR